MEYALEFERRSWRIEDEMVNESRSCFEKLDETITIDILSRLSVYSLFQCRAVCHNWRRIIVYDPYFANIHSNRSIQTHNKIINTTAPEPFDDSGLSYIIQVNSSGRGNNLLFVEGGLMSKHPTIIDCHFDRFWPPYPLDYYHFQIGPSCNGLLCLRLGHNRYHEPVAVCNPVTGEYVSLPESDDSPVYDVVTGFGFDSINEVYKVVRMSNRPLRDYLTDVEIHTLGTENWRPIESPPDVVDDKYYSSQQVFVNGSFHWSTKYGEAFVVALDISTEKFHTILLPPKLWLHEYKEIELCNWKGRLGLIAKSKESPIHVWQLKNDNGGLWTQILTLPTIFPERHPNIYDICSKYFRSLNFNSIDVTTCHVGSIVSLKNIIKEEEKVKMIPKLGWINQTSSCKRKYPSPLEVKTEKSSCEIQLPLLMRLNQADYDELDDIKSEWENMSETERDSLWKDMCFHNPREYAITSSFSTFLL